MKTLETLPLPPSTDRQRIAHTRQRCDRTVTRWIRYVEAHSLDWLRTCPDGETTPVDLHPYQAWLLELVMAEAAKRKRPKEWLTPFLLKGGWSYAEWKTEITGENNRGR